MLVIGETLVRYRFCMDDEHMHPYNGQGKEGSDGEEEEILFFDEEDIRSGLKIVPKA